MKHPKNLAWLDESDGHWYDKPSHKARSDLRERAYAAAEEAEKIYLYIQSLGDTDVSISGLTAKTTQTNAYATLSLALSKLAEA